MSRAPHRWPRLPVLLSRPLSLLVLIASLVCWRMVATWPQWWVLGLASLLSLSAIIGSIASSIACASAPQRVAIICGLAAAVAALGLSDTAWPCTVRCSDGAWYGSILGMPVPALATAWYASTALVCGWLAQARSRMATQPGSPATWPTRLAAAMGWGAVGASLYYLSLSLYLGLMCSHCLAVHSMVLCLPAYLIRFTPWSWLGRASAMLLPALAIHALYHPWVRPSADIDTGSSTDSWTGTAGFTPAQARPATIDAGSLRLAMQVDQGRSWGRSEAPLLAELVLDPHCSKCREHYPKLRAVMQPAIEQGRLRLVLRLRSTATIDGTSAAIRVLYAAAADRQCADVLGTILGVGTEQADLAQRLAGPRSRLLDLAADYADLFDAITRADSQRLRSLDAQRGGVPQVIISGPGQREPIDHLRQPITTSQLEAALAAAWSVVQDQQ